MLLGIKDNPCKIHMLVLKVSIQSLACLIIITSKHYFFFLFFHLVHYFFWSRIEYKTKWSLRCSFIFKNCLLACISRSYGGVVVLPYSVLFINLQGLLPFSICIYLYNTNWSAMDYLNSLEYVFYSLPFFLKKMLFIKKKIIIRAVNSDKLNFFTQ